MIAQAQAPRHLTAAEEADLARRRDAGDATAVQELVASNVELAYYLAFRRRGRPGRNPVLSDEDLAQQAVIEGLYRAARKFDPARGRFTTVAGWWIRQSIGRNRRQGSWPVYVPNHARNGNAGPHVREQVERVDRTVSIDAKSGGDDGARRSMPTLAAVLADRNAAPAGAALEAADEAEWLRGALGRIEPELAEAVRLRYGLGGPGPLGLVAMGRRLGIGKQTADNRVRLGLEALRREAGVDGEGRP